MNTAIFSFLAVIYIGSLIAFLLQVGPYGRFDAKRRKIGMLLYTLGGIFMIYITINFLRSLMD